MANADKARIKAGAADEILVDLDETIANADRTEVGIRGSRDGLNRVLSKFHGYRRVIEHAHDSEGEDALTDEEYKAGLHVFVTMVNMVAGIRKDLDVKLAGQPAMIAGLRRARAVVERKRDNELNKARRAEAEEAEEDDYREAQGDQEPEPVDMATATEPTAEPPIEVVICAHCGDEITVPTGAKLCSSCVSHRNRYKRLPTKRAIASRRERNANT